MLQILSVPVLVHLWGVPAYGEWLMITTIPTYFALSDLGFSDAATSDMTIAFARGERDRVVTTFQSVLLLALVIAAIALALAIPLAFAAHAGAGSAWWRANHLTLLLMVAYSAAALCSRIVLSAHRSTGHYASGTLIYDFLQALEGFSALAVALADRGFASAAAAYLAWRLINIIVMLVMLRRWEPWLSIGFARARRAELKRLLWPALGAMAIPTALSINIQGMILVAGAMISPVAAATLGPVRTLSRIAIQIVGVVNRSTMPEFSAAASRHDVHGLRRLLELNLLAILVVLLPGALLFGFFGSRLVARWTAESIVPSPKFVALMAAAMVFNGLWYFTSNLLLAVNAHARLSFVAAAASVVSIGLAIPLARNFGLNGLAFSILCAELAAVVFLALFRKRLISGASRQFQGEAPLAPFQAERGAARPRAGA